MICLGAREGCDWLVAPSSPEPTLHVFRRWIAAAVEALSYFLSYLHLQLLPRTLGHIKALHRATVTTL